MAKLCITSYNNITHVSLLGFGAATAGIAATCFSSFGAAAPTCDSFFPLTGTRNCSPYKCLLTLMHHASMQGTLCWQYRSTDWAFNRTQSPSSLLTCERQRKTHGKNNEQDSRGEKKPNRKTALEPRTGKKREIIKRPTLYTSCAEIAQGGGGYMGQSNV